jgi:hypothetical protein
VLDEPPPRVKGRGACVKAAVSRAIGGPQGSSLS